MNERFDKIKKYVVSSRMMILVIIVCIISLLVYCLLNTYTIGSILIHNYLARQIVANVVLVITSITGTNLLTSLIIEKNSKNEGWRDIISEDVLSNHAFYDYMDSQTKDAISSAIKYSINEYNNTVIQNEIMESIIDKLNFQNETYYFEKCEYNVNCEIFDTYIKYEMSRVTRMYSFEDEYTINNFRVATVANMCNNEDGISHIEVSLNGQRLAADKFIVNKEGSYKQSDIEINKYNTIKHIYLKEPLTLHSDRKGEKNCTTIVFKYVAETTLDDVINVYRTSQPCKNLSVYFNLETKGKYKLVSAPFGFIDTPDGEGDMDADYISKVEFNDWVFKDDGVVVAIVAR